MMHKESAPEIPPHKDPRAILVLLPVEGLCPGDPVWLLPNDPEYDEVKKLRDKGWLFSDPPLRLYELARAALRRRAKAEKAK